MSNNPWILVAIAGIGFGLWPIMARWSRMTPSLTGIAVALGTLFTVAILSVYLNRQPISAPSTWTVPFVAGLINGCGFVAFTKLTTNPVWPSGYSSAALILMILVVSVGGIVVFKEPISITKVAGLILGITAIFLLTK